MLSKRFWGICLCVLLLLAGLSAAAAGSGPNGEISLGLDETGGGSYAPAQVQVVQLNLDGTPVESDVPAFVRGGRTMVPVRVVTERMGAQVAWLAESNQVSISLAGNEVVLQIGSAQALVNGQEETLYDGIPAMVAKYRGIERTMVPLRFVAEQLGARVDWEQETYTALIDISPPAYQVSSVRADAGAQLVQIVTTDTPEYRLTDLGDRVVVDVLDAGISAGRSGTISVDSEWIAQVRWASHWNDLYPEYSHAVRVVLDLQEGVTWTDNLALLALPRGLLLAAGGPGEAAERLPAVELDPEKQTVVVDAGHGGAQTGALYEEIAEKEINLAVARKVEAELRGAGYNVVMTRTTDATVGLYTRADIANAADADLFVSIHSNAAVNNTDFAGAYTYHHTSSARGARLARAIQGPLCERTQAIDRGIHHADFVVLRETNMCAALVEMGFMTNHEELLLLTTPAYQDALAAGIAQGVAAYLAENEAN